MTRLQEIQQCIDNGSLRISLNPPDSCSQRRLQLRPRLQQQQQQRKKNVMLNVLLFTIVSQLLLHGNTHRLRKSYFLQMTEASSLASLWWSPIKRVIPSSLRTNGNKSNRNRKLDAKRSVHDDEATTIARDFFQLKCGCNDIDVMKMDDATATLKPTVWIYSGTLIDSYTGQSICNVEGIEFIQPLASIKTTIPKTAANDNNEINNNIDNINYNHGTSRSQQEQDRQQIQRYLNKCRSLQIVPIIEQLINNKDSSQKQEQQQQQQHIQLQCYTMFSRKLFCYTALPSSSGSSANAAAAASDSSVLLRTIQRNPPLGPTTTIPTNQVISCYDSIVSALSVSQENHNSSSNRWNRHWLHTEFPRMQKKCIWSPINTPNNMFVHNQQNPLQKNQKHQSQFPKKLDFSIFTRRRTVPLSLSVLLPSSELVPNGNITNTVVREKRHRPFIQFSRTDRSGAGSNSRPNELGVRETYQYSTVTSLNNNKEEKSKKSSKIKTSTPRTALRYTRYGEAPVWYGPGRACQLELTGICIPNFQTRKQQLLPASSTRSDDNDATVAVANQFVPIAMNVIQRYVSNFWDCDLMSSDKQQKLSPTFVPRKYWTRQRSNNKGRFHHNTDDSDFIYFASALQPGFQTLQTINNIADRGSDSLESKPQAIQEYRQLYKDIAVGRCIENFFDQQQQLIVTDIADQQNQQRYRHLTLLYDRLLTSWDKVRTASTLSIGR